MMHTVMCIIFIDTDLEPCKIVISKITSEVKEVLAQFMALDPQCTVIAQL